MNGEDIEKFETTGAGQKVTKREKLLATQAPPPSLAQVRQAVNEYVILPTGSREVHQHCPYASSGFGKNCLLYGPKGVGKTMLIHAAAAELGALIFDLSPATTDGLYPGKKNEALLVQKVFKVAKALVSLHLLRLRAVFCCLPLRRFCVALSRARVPGGD